MPITLHANQLDTSSQRPLRRAYREEISYNAYKCDDNVTFVMPFLCLLFIKVGTRKLHIFI